MLSTTRKTWALTVACIALAGISWTANAQDRDVAMEILKESGDFYMDADTLSFKATASFEGVFDGESQSLTTDYVVALKRPKDASIRMSNAEMEMSYFVDGVSTTRYIPELKQYMVADGAPIPGVLIRQAAIYIMTPGMKVLSEILMPDPFSALLKVGPDHHVAFIGFDEIDGVKANHVQFEYDEFICDVWIEAGPAPRVMRIKPEMAGVAQELKAKRYAKDTIELSLVIDIADQEFGANVDAQLAFDPGADIQKVTEFHRAAPEPEAKKLLGKAAPDFKLDLMQGGTIDLAAKKGNEIVILDFWATWCGPCRVAMPIIDKVSKEFAEKDVRLYAVNLEEDGPTINRFLKGQNLDVTVALDNDSAVAALYKAESIPQTVIIGKDGTVQVVHVGIGPNLEDELRAELTALTNGETLAK